MLEVNRCDQLPVNYFSGNESVSGSACLLDKFSQIEMEKELEPGIVKVITGPLWQQQKLLTDRGDGKACPVTGCVFRNLHEEQSKTGWITPIVLGADMFWEDNLRRDNMGRLTLSKSKEAHQEVRHLLTWGW